MDNLEYLNWKHYKNNFTYMSLEELYPLCWFDIYDSKQKIDKDNGKEEES